MQISKRRAIQVKGIKTAKVLRWKGTSVSIRDREIAGLAGMQ